MLKKVGMIALLMLLVAAPAAQADWLFTPGLGTTFGADTHGREHPILSAGIGWVDEERFGWELDLGFAPDFFEGDHETFVFNGDSHVGTLMVNALLGIPGAFEGGGVHPFLTGGVGVMQMRAVTEAGPDEDLFETLVHEVGFNVGGGAVAFFGDSIGIRGEVRYISSFQNGLPSWTQGLDVDVAPGRFDFLRATFGVTFRFPD